MFIFNISSLSSSFVIDADLHIYKKRLRVGGGGKRKLPRDWDKRAKLLRQQAHEQQHQQRKKEQMQRRGGGGGGSASGGANEVHEKGRRREEKEGKRKRRKRKEGEEEVVVMQLFEVAPTYMSAVDEIILPIGE